MSRWKNFANIFESNFSLIQPSSDLLHSDKRKDKGCYTLIFSKKEMSSRARELMLAQTSLGTIFNLVLLHRLSVFLRSNSSTSYEILKEFRTAEKLSRLREQLENVLQNNQLRKLFLTMAFHFDRHFGTLTAVVKGFSRYPPPHEAFYLPPLTLKKYRNEDRPVLFFNESHVIPVDFRTYELDKFHTILNPFPVYDREKNLIIRDLTNNVCRMQAKFQYQKSARAKLASASENDTTDYMFLFILDDKYYQVVAIYPRGYISLANEERKGV